MACRENNDGCGDTFVTVAVFMNCVCVCLCVCVSGGWYWAHNNDVIMTTIGSQITSLTIVYSVVYSVADQRKYQSSASLAFVWGIHRGRWIPRTKGQLRGNCFHLMTSSWVTYLSLIKKHPCVFEIYIIPWLNGPGRWSPFSGTERAVYLA